MIKKLLLVSIAAIILIFGLFVLTGCGENNSESSPIGNKQMQQAVKEYTQNSDDDKYFKPATDDYLMYTDKDIGVTKVTMVSFDTNGKIVQKVEREEYTDDESDYSSFIPNETQKVSRDKKVMYDDRTNDLDSSENKTTSEKFRTIHEYSRAANDSEKEKLYMSKGLTQNDTKTTRTDDSYPAIQALKSIALANGNDYEISVRKEKVNRETNYADYRGQQVLVNNAFSYYTANVCNYDENGNIIKIYTAYVFDNPQMIEDYKMYSASRITNEGKAVLNEEVYNNSVKASNAKIKDNIYYMDSNDQNLDNEYNTKKWNDLIEDYDGYYSYFSVPYLTDSQIQQMYNTKR